MQNAGEIGKCRQPDCQALILMLKHERTRNPAPIELLTSENGNIEIDTVQGTYRILTKEALADARERKMPLHLNHFAGCKYARSFAKGARAHA